MVSSLDAPLNIDNTRQLQHMAEEKAVATIPEDLSRLSSVIDKKPEAFASGDDEIRNTALEAAKYIFDLSAFRPVYAHSRILILLSF